MTIASLLIITVIPPATVRCMEIIGPALPANFNNRYNQRLERTIPLIVAQDNTSYKANGWVIAEKNSKKSLGIYCNRFLAT